MNGAYLIALVLAFGFGAMAKLLGVPAPAPPTLLGVLLVVAVTVGYIVVPK